VSVTDDLFAAAWSRVDRARELRRVMADIWGDYIARHPFTPSLIGEGDGVYVLRVWEDEPPPVELAVATGEWLYNVRSALDYIVWATAAHETRTIPPPSEAHLQYPIYDTEAAWDSNLYRLKHLAEHHRSMMKVMQPFNSDMDANYLGWINRLARIDRHRHLNHVTAYLAEVEPVFAVPDGCAVSLRWGERVVRDGKADVAQVTVDPWEEGMEIEFNPRIGIDAEIEAWSGSEFWRRINYSERLRVIEVFVAGEIAAYEYDCTGAGRKADVLTESYRQECDERREANKPSPKREPRDAVAWGEAEVARIATRHAQSDSDFPPDGPGAPRHPIFRG
jgi:hypothetical protein